MTMKQFFYAKTGVMARIAVWLLMIFYVGVHGLNAQDVVELTIEGGQVYTLKARTTYHLTFTAPTAGQLILMQKGGDGCTGYKTALFTEEIPDCYPQFRSGGKETILNCKEGRTYYFETSTWSSSKDQTLEVSFGEPRKLAVERAYPEIGAVIDMAQNANLSFVFNTDVSVGTCFLSVGGARSNVEVNVYGGNVSVSVRDVLMAWLEDGTLQQGSEFTLTLQGVCEAYDSGSLYGTDGVMTVKYIVSGMPARLLSVNHPEGTPFLSYYMLSDESGSLCLEFDKPLAGEGAEARLGYGNMEGSDYYSEDLEVRVDGSCLYVLLSGKLRRSVDMLPEASEKYPTVSIVLNNVRDAEGRFVLSENVANVGSFTFNYDLKELNYSIASDYLPAVGSSLEGVENIEIWIDGDADGVLVYDGVDFICTVDGKADTVHVEAGMITRVEDMENPGAYILTVPVPVMKADSGSEVVVELSGLECRDGLEHKTDVMGVYKTAATDGVSLVAKDGVRVGAVYTLDGRCVVPAGERMATKQPVRGIYIVDGKTVLFK